MPVTCHFEDGPLAGTTYTIVAGVRPPTWMKYAVLPGKDGTRWALDWARVGGEDLADVDDEPWPNEVRYALDRQEEGEEGVAAHYGLVSIRGIRGPRKLWQIMVAVSMTDTAGRRTVGTYASIVESGEKPTVETTAEVTEVATLPEPPGVLSEPSLDLDWRRGGAEPAGPGRWSPND